jgi:N-acetylmuramoyl-L-alanine amidase
LSVAAALLSLTLPAGACSSSSVAGSDSPQKAPTTVSSTSFQPSSPDVPAVAIETARAGRLAGRRICLDPGHDAIWDVGATGRDGSGDVAVHPTEGIRLDELELNLKVTYRLAGLLQQEGAEVCVTRREDGPLQIEPYDFTGDGQVRTEGEAVEDSPERIQPRIDWANNFGAEVLVSVHFNGNEDPEVRGTEVYYSDVGPLAERGRTLAEALLRATLDELRGGGYEPSNRGVLSDRFERYPSEVSDAFRRNNAPAIIANGADPGDCADCTRLGVLGNNPMSLHMGTYVGALVEVEFLSNPYVVETLLMRADSVDLIAAGLASGLLAYFEGP